jgi:hypothetical protein
MSILRVAKLEGITQTNFEITVPSTHKLIVAGILRSDSIQNTSGVNIWSPDASGNVTIGGNIVATNGTVTANILTATGRVNLPTWTTATRPTTNLVNGVFGYNIDTGIGLEVYVNGQWQTLIQATPGLSASNPATSAAQISTSGTRTDGNYWYKPSGYTGSAIQLYTNFTNAPAGKGYVLVARGRESTDWWNNNGQNTGALLSTNLDTNTPIAVVPSDFVNRLIGGNWNTMRFLTNRRNGGDSWLFGGTTSTTFSWTYFQQSASSVSATAQRYNGLWLTGGLNTNWASGTQWTDTLNNGGSNDCQRTFTWSWSGHGSWQGWSGGSSCTPAGSFQVGGEGHALQLVNCYVEC